MVSPAAYTPRTTKLLSPSVELVKVAPPLAEMPNPSVVAAYTVSPTAYTQRTLSLPSPSAVVKLVKVAPPSVEMPTPPPVAA